MAPIMAGASLLVRTGLIDKPGKVIAVFAWHWILVETTDGRLWLDVMMNISFVSWSRLVLLDANVSKEDLPLIENIARDIMWHPKRTDVADVLGAERLCPPEDKLIL